MQELDRGTGTEHQAEWEKALRAQPIKSIRVFSSGLADKFQVTVGEKAYLAALKPVSLPLVFERDWESVPAVAADISDQIEPKRADRVIQVAS